MALISSLMRKVLFEKSCSKAVPSRPFFSVYGNAASEKLDGKHGLSHGHAHYQLLSVRGRWTLAEPRSRRERFTVIYFTFALREQVHLQEGEQVQPCDRTCTLSSTVSSPARYTGVHLA